jgi:hypothetical protein
MVQLCNLRSIRMTSGYVFSLSASIKTIPLLGGMSVSIRTRRTPSSAPLIARYNPHIEEGFVAWLVITNDVRLS